MKTVKRITIAAETRLERHVKAWINREAVGYPDSGASGVLRDLFYGGCSSGIVGHLVYTSDCVKFFKAHRRDISAILTSTLSDTGLTIANLFSNPRSITWDPSDPLGQEDGNRNALAWFGFEEAARAIAERQGIEV